MLLKTKLLILFLVAGIVPIAIVGITSSSLASSALMQKSYDQLVSIREIKKNQISNYFDGREGDIGILVETVSTLRMEAVSKLKAIQLGKESTMLNYIHGMKTELELIRTDGTLQEALLGMRSAFASAGGNTGSGT